MSLYGLISSSAGGLKARYQDYSDNQKKKKRLLFKQIAYQDQEDGERSPLFLNFSYLCMYLFLQGSTPHLRQGECSGSPVRGWLDHSGHPQPPSPHVPGPLHTWAKTQIHSRGPPSPVFRRDPPLFRCPLPAFSENKEEVQ